MKFTEQRGGKKESEATAFYPASIEGLEWYLEEVIKKIYLRDPVEKDVLTIKYYCPDKLAGLKDIYTVKFNDDIIGYITEVDTQYELSALFNYKFLKGGYSS